MTGSVNLVQTKITVLNTAFQIGVEVTRTGDLTSDASVNVLFRGSDFYFPSAGGYDGIKAGATWLAGEGGTKIVVIPLVPTLEKLTYLDIELVDFLRVNPGQNLEGSIAIHSSTITPSWIPAAPGSYYQQIKVANSGVSVEVVPVSFGTIPNMVGATATEDGEAGIVPQPKAGDNSKYLKGNGFYETLPVFDEAQAGIVPAPPGGGDKYLRSDGSWQTLVIPAAGIASIEGVSNPGGNIDFVGESGIIVSGDDALNVITISLPPGTAANQTLVWNPLTEVYEPQALPSNIEIYTGATLTQPGTSGIVSAPPAGQPNRYAAADGLWRTEGTIPGQVGGTNGRVVRITDTANTWIDASNSDTVDELYKAGLAFKQGDQYYTPGSVVNGLSNLETGRVYYLDLNGLLTTTVPIPSASTRRVAIGKAIAPDKLSFNPGEVITGL